jgi:hypothetical protein
MHLSEPGECGLKVKNINVGSYFQTEGIIEGNLLPASPTLGCSPLAGVVNEYLSHRTGSNPKEVRPVLPIDAGVINQTEVGLVHERTRLQRVIRPLAPHQVRGKPAQLTVGDLEELIGSLAMIDMISMEFEEDLCDLVPADFTHLDSRPRSCLEPDV